MTCINGDRECVGCMKCSSDGIYYCPVCGSEVEEMVYLQDKEIIGCDICVVEMSFRKMWA